VFAEKPVPYFLGRNETDRTGGFCYNLHLLLRCVDDPNPLQEQNREFTSTKSTVRRNAFARGWKSSSPISIAFSTVSDLSYNSVLPSSSICKQWFNADRVPFPEGIFWPAEKNRKLHIICKTARYLITVDPVLVQQQSCAGPRPPYLAVQSPVSSPTYGSRSWVGPGGGGHRELAGRCH